MRACKLRLSSVQKSQTWSCAPGAIPCMAALWKFSWRSFCQPGLSPLVHAGSVGGLWRTSTVDGVRCTT